MNDVEKRVSDKHEDLEKVVNELQSALKDKKEEIEAIRESKRVFGVNGIHEVRFFNNNDSVVFKHEALSRNIFSEGALTIAKSIIKKEPNLYSVKDFFN